VAAWTQIPFTPSPSRVRAARFRPDGTWGPSLEVARGSRPDTFMDRRGNAHIVAEGRRGIFAFHQSARRPWGTGRSIATGFLFDAAGRGESLIALYEPSPGSGLRAVTWRSRR
jgi:hypothetical protein